MTDFAVQVCVLFSLLVSLVHSQAPTFDPNAGAGNPFGNLGGTAGGTFQPFDPNFVPNPGTIITDPGINPNLVNPNLPPMMPHPLPRPNPFQSMLPYLMFRGGDFGPMMMLMSMLGGGGGFGGGGGGLFSNPFLAMSFLNKLS